MIDLFKKMEKSQDGKSFKYFDMFSVSISEEIISFEDSEYLSELLDCGLVSVPVLYQGPYHQSMPFKYAHGNSLLNDSQIREGCVVRPLRERKTFKGHRVIAKCVSSQYLSRKGKSNQEPTEFS